MGFAEWSPWQNEPDTLQPPLRGSEKADVAIIGGGYTGLNCALELRSQGVDVILLEQDFCGRGSSGRNAGHLTPTIGTNFPQLVKDFGETKAVELTRFAERAVLHTESVIERLGIDCDFKPTGNVIGGVHPSHRRGLEDMHALASRLGVGVQFMDEREVRRRKLPPFVRFGVLESHGGLLNPGKYIAGLRAQAIRAGVRIFESTRVTNFARSDNGVHVQTTEGDVRADQLVVATNAYTPVTLRKKRHVFPLRVTLFWTAPLTPEQRAALEWPGEEGIYTTHNALENYRLTADGRLSGGSKTVQYGWGSSLSPGYLPDVFKDWKSIFAARFAHVPGLEIETFWGGWIGMTLDYLPILRSEEGERIHYGMGFNGHGIAQGTLFGKLLADVVKRNETSDAELFRRRIPPLPPEPLRWLVIQALFRSFYSGDKRVDADIAAGRI